LPSGEGHPDSIQTADWLLDKLVPQEEPRPYDEDDQLMLGIATIMLARLEKGELGLDGRRAEQMAPFLVAAFSSLLCGDRYLV
jgi:hypothetical protein